MVSLEFCIDIILPAALWPLGWFSLPPEMGTKNISWGVERQLMCTADKLTTRNEYQEYFLGRGKAADVYGWQTYHLHVPIILKIWEPQTPGTLQACSGLYRNSRTFYLRPFKNISSINCLNIAYVARKHFHFVKFVLMVLKISPITRIGLCKLRQ